MHFLGSSALVASNHRLPFAEGVRAAYGLAKMHSIANLRPEMRTVYMGLTYEQ